MVQYIIQIIAFQVFFLLVYDVFLKKETFFNWNRFYLIGTSVLSFILPFIKVTAFKEIVPKDYIVALPEVFIGNRTISNAEVILPEVEIAKQGFSWNLETLFYLGIAVASLLFILKITHIFLLIFKNPKQWKGNILLVKLINSTSAFSFFHYVFLGSNLKDEEQKVIIKHELVHVTQKHTLDLLFFEVQRILFWFNPLVYMYQARIRSLHEYIADQEALKTHNKSDYYQNLLTQVFETENVSFINAFFKKSLIKKRIMMLSKSKSKQIVKFKYALLIPVVFAMLVFTTNAQTNSVSNTTSQEVSSQNLKEKFYKELLKKENAGVSLQEIGDEYLPDYNKYRLSEEEYYKFMAYQKFIDENPKRLPSDAVEGLAEKIHSGFGIIKGEYDDYLAYKKTEEAKKEWEDNAAPSTLRIVVDDFGNLTPAKQKEYDEKMALIKNNNYYKKLIIESNNMRASFNMDNNKPKQQETVMIDEVEVPFAVIEEPPLFEECEALSKDDRRKCFSDMISTFVQQNFNTDLAGDLGLTGRQTIRVIFKINQEGDITSVVARAPHPQLEEEAKRVIKSLPKLIPGKQKGKAVIVPYSLPIIFQIADKTDVKPSDNTNKVKHEEVPNKYQEVEVPFAVIEQPPMSKECETLSTTKEQRKCTSEAISKHVQKNFNTDLANDLGLTGRQTIRAMFKIDKEGDVTSIMVRAPHSKLEEETERVIKTLPKMIPGKQKGKTVAVPYSLPIVFQVADKTDEKPSNSNNKVKHEEVSNKNQDIEVPYSHIEQPPMSKECKMLTSTEEQRKCTSNAITMHVMKNFNTNLAGDLGLLGRQTIRTMFKIDEKGRIVNIKVRAPHPKLEEEAKRVIKSLPKMIPGKQKGKKVVVPYSLPIIFQVVDKKKQDLNEVPLVAVDESPIYPGCDVTSSSDKLKECFKNSVTNFISKEFGKNLPKNIDSELEPRQKIYAMFKIDKTGYIESIRVRAKHPELENEAIRVLKSLPKMTPGKHKGKTVIVPYSVPIMYELENKKN